MPKQVVDAWQKELRTWLAQQDFELAIAERPEWESAIPLRLRKQYRKLKRQGWLNRLDECHGDCVLRQPELSMLVAKTLLHFEGDRYDTDCLVVMPNHVHLIVQFRSGTSLAKQTRSWLQYSAREVNQRLGRQGKFWQSEPFDHLIRSEEQFHYLRRYIAENPEKAGLGVGEYLYWNRVEGFQ
ncbi:MAG: transposase [Lacipirellulaceae bacterium]